MMNYLYLQDRSDACTGLVDLLHVIHLSSMVVLALPLGRVPFAIEISNKYAIPFDVIHAIKLVHPLHSEFAIGAMCEKSEPLLNDEVNVEQKWVDQEAVRVRKEIARRRELYDVFLEEKSLKGKDIILVDDGIATGMTM